MTSDFPVVVDACVLVQSAVRDILLRLFERRLYLARWSVEIIDETVRTLRDKLGVTPEQEKHLVDELRAHLTDAWVESGYREHIPVMKNDEKHRHVLAAAGKSGCEVIGTNNLKHFPEDALKPHGIIAKHPDEFLMDLYYVNGEMVIHQLHEQGASLRKPHSIDEVLGWLEICRCNQFVKLIREKLA
jgi:predicted nucleic acid-binding protein